MNSEKKPGRTDAQHRGDIEEARPQEGGRAGGQPQKGEKMREPQTQEELEREKARRGKESPPNQTWDRSEVRPTRTSSAPACTWIAFPRIARTVDA